MSSCRVAMCEIFIRCPVLSPDIEEPARSNSSLPGEIGPDQHGTADRRRSRQALLKVAVEHPVGITSRKRLARAVEHGDVHETDTVLELEDLVIESTRIAQSQLD